MLSSYSLFLSFKAGWSFIHDHYKVIYIFHKVCHVSFYIVTHVPYDYLQELIFLNFIFKGVIFYFLVVTFHQALIFVDFLNLVLVFAEVVALLFFNYVNFYLFLLLLFHLLIYKGAQIFN